MSIAFAILFGLFFHSANETASVGEILPGSPAAQHSSRAIAILAFDGKRFPGLGRGPRLNASATMVASHKCAGKQIDGCPASDPGQDDDRRDGEVRTLTIRPVTTPMSAARGSDSPTGPCPSACRRLGAAGQAVERDVAGHDGHGPVFSQIFQAQERKKISRDRRDQRRHPPGIRVRSTARR